MFRLLRALILGPPLVERDDVERTPAQRLRRAFLLFMSANGINMRFISYMERLGFDRTGLHVWDVMLREWREDSDGLRTIDLPLGAGVRGKIEAVRFLKPYDEECDEELQILARLSFRRRRIFTTKRTECSEAMRAALVDYVAFVITVEDSDWGRERLGEWYLKYLAGPFDPTVDGWKEVAADWWDEQGRTEIAAVLLGRLPAWNEPPFSPERDEPSQ